jgi:hypothetical protein
VVDASERGVCHLGHRTCFSQPVDRGGRDLSDALGIDVIDPLG